MKNITNLLSNKFYLITLPIIIVIATILYKLFFTTNYGLWYDETFSVFYSQGTFSEIRSVSKWDANPPFFNYALHIWIKLFGISEIAVRLFSLFCNAITAIVVYFFTKRFFNLQTAILTSVLFFTSNIFFFYAQEARAYSFLFLLYIISSWIFFNVLKNPRLIYLIALGIVNYIIILTHYIEGIIILFQGIVVIISWNRKSILHFVSACGLTLLLLNKWLFRLYDIFMGGGNKIVGEPHITDIYIVFKSLLNNSAVFVISFLVLFIVGLIYFIRKKNEFSENKLFVTYLILIAFISHCILYMLSFKAPMYTTRYLMFTLPCLYILIAYFVSILSVRKWIFYVLTVGYFILGISTIEYKISKGMDYKHAVPYVKEKQDDRTVILLQTTDMGALFSYYYDIEIFKQYKHIRGLLMNENVFMFNDTNNLSIIDFAAYKQIIVCQTFVKKDGLLITYLNNNFKRVDSHIKFDGIDIAFYENLNVDTTHIIKKKTQKEAIIFGNILKINEDINWYNSIKDRAIKQGIPIDTLIYKDAVWLCEN